MKTPQTKLDKILAQMSRDELIEFKRLAKMNTNVSDLHRWLLEHGHQISWNSVSRWCHRDRAKEQTKLLNAASEVFSALEHEMVLNTLGGLALGLVHEVYSKCEPKLDRLTPEEAMKLLPLTADWMREARGAIAQANSIKQEASPQAQTFEGVDRFCEILQQQLLEEYPHAHETITHTLLVARQKLALELKE